MTDDRIGDKGVKALSEMFEVNTTLTSLDMSCEEEERGREKEKDKRRMNDRE